MAKPAKKKNVSKIANKTKRTIQSIPLVLVTEENGDKRWNGKIEGLDFAVWKAKKTDTWCWTSHDPRKQASLGGIAFQSLQAAVSKAKELLAIPMVEGELNPEEEAMRMLEMRARQAEQAQKKKKEEDKEEE